MNSLEQGLFACLVALLVSCGNVPAECESLADELSFPLGFASYEAGGKSVESWRTDLTNALVDAITYSEEIGEPTRPRLIGSSEISGVRVFDYELESRIDGALIPFGLLLPRSAQGTDPKDFVMVLHGHGDTVAAAFDERSSMHNIGGRLLDEGYVVVSVEMRSFGAYKIDGKDHEEYVADLRDGEYVGQVLSDNIQVAQAAQSLFPPEHVATFSVFGHSFGGYIALHIGALNDWVDRTMSSGHFAPYGCINTDFHHACQDILAIEGLFEIYDTAALIAPRRVDLFFGGLDSLFTGASVEAYRRLEVLYEKLGGAGKADLHITPWLEHEVDVDAVLANLP
jgi:dienelactone hydrolase